MKSILPIILCAIALTVFTSLKAQYHLELGANYVYSFGQDEVNFQGQKYMLNTTQGFEITANNLYQFKDSAWIAVIEVGYRQLGFSGESVDLKYNGTTHKFTAAFGARYLIQPKFRVGAYFELENNLDFEYWATQRADLLRYSVSGEIAYSPIKNLWVTALYNFAYSPITDAYVIFNPQNQFRLGLTYQFL